jgi:heme exporter protein CcmD
MSAFFDMGGYGGFIWSAYGITALVLGALVVQGFARARRLSAILNDLDPSRTQSR